MERFLTVDIDDTLITATAKKCECCGATTYSDFKPIQGEIDRVNAAFESGVRIILHTGRNWDKYNSTKLMLLQMDINYNELVMGKPPGPYVDKTMNYKSIGDING